MSVATLSHRGRCKASPLARLPRMPIPHRPGRLVLVLILALAACGPPRVRDGVRTLAPQRLLRRPPAVAPGRVVRVQLDSGAARLGIVLDSLGAGSDALRMRVLPPGTGPSDADALGLGFPDSVVARIAMQDVRALWVSDPPVHGMLQLFTFGGALAGGWTGPRDGESRMNEGGLAIGMLLGAVAGIAVERRTWYWQQVYPCPDRCAAADR